MDNILNIYLDVLTTLGVVIMGKIFLSKIADEMSTEKAQKWTNLQF